MGNCQKDVKLGLFLDSSPSQVNPGSTVTQQNKQVLNMHLKQINTDSISNGRTELLGVTLGDSSKLIHMLSWYYEPMSSYSYIQFRFYKTTSLFEKLYLVQMTPGEQK